MASVNSAALNMLTREQAEEAARIIDAIGFVSNDLGATEAAVKLDQARTDLNNCLRIPPPSADQGWPWATDLRRKSSGNAGCSGGGSSTSRSAKVLNS